MKKPKIFLGIFLIIIGLLILLKILGILNTSWATFFITYWPVFLIIIGFAMVFDIKWLSFVFTLLLVVVFCVYIYDNFAVGNYREVNQQVALNPGITNAELIIGFSAGEINIGRGEDNYLLRNIVKTAARNDPTIDYSTFGNTASVDVSILNQVHFARGDKWNMLLNPSVIYAISMNYGASKSNIDLTGLKVKSLNIDSGAVSTEVILAKYPSKITIQTGASSIDLKYPRDYGIVIEIDGGAVSRNLNGLRKEGNFFYSENYDKNGENIEIKVNAGASSVDGDFI